LAVGAIVTLIVVAYWNSFSGALVYDDRASITENMSIRQLWPLSTVLAPPDEAGTGGRPIGNFTFALSYALSGLEPWGHHVVNVTIHILTALTLFGVVRRTLLQPALREGLGRDSFPLAVAIAALWAVHPLQTQVVTYLSQRTESLMALFYLLTVYCFIRGTEARPRVWHTLAFLACLLGVMSKEVIATVPLLVLLYDRTFVSGTLIAAWRRHWRLYVALASTWLLLALLLIGVRERGVGYGLGIPWFEYALTECKAVVTYVRLGLWPHPLIFDRGVTLIKTVADALPYVVVLISLLGATIWALCKRPVLGFTGAWFFVILAPTSSVVPVIQQPIAENRPYLPVAAVIALAVATLYLRFGRRTVVAVCSVLAAVCVVATAQRNRDFASEIALWTDTVAKSPLNARAHYNLGVALNYAGRTAEAMVHYSSALEISPDYPEARNNLGNALVETGRIQEGLPHLEAAVRLRPSFADAHYNLGNAFLHTNRSPEAIPHYQVALRLDPARPKARNNLGIAFLRTNRPDAAIREFEQSIALKVDFYDAQMNLAVVLLQVGRHLEALRHAEFALKLRPHAADARRTADAIRSAARAAGAQP
jgi:tetratricopeptide (TPR) repeat protein